MKLLRRLSLLTATVSLLSSIAASQATVCSDQGSWATLNATYNYNGRFNENIGITSPILLTDGRVAAQYWGSFGGLVTDNSWFTLSPDNTGSYTNPTLLWNQIASLPSTYAPGLFASAVLSDGKLIVEGGEYNFGTHAWTAQGAVYDPVMNSWTSVSPPSGSSWSRIGDAPSSVLANGTYMLGSCCNSLQVLLNESTLTWSSTGTGKADSNSEEGWTLLPNGDVLTIDIGAGDGNPHNSELYNPTSGSWITAGDTGVALYGTSADGSTEIGPAILRPDGTVFATGAYVGSDSTAHTAIYNTTTGIWSAGPNIPSPYGMGDAPAALLRNGKVLFAASPFNATSPTQFFEFDGAHICELTIGVPPTLAATWNSEDEMLLLPTGQVLVTNSDGGSDPNQYFYVFTPNDTSIYSGSAPTLTAITTTLLQRGATYLATGRQFNGMSQANAYGDDFQNATNYPLVRITNDSTGDVFYAKTHDHSTMGVATGATATSTHFVVPSGMETGASHLVVVANGIASNSLPVTVLP